MAKKKTANKKDNQADRPAPQLPGVEDNLSPALVTAMKEYGLADEALKRAKKRTEEANERVLERMREDDLAAVRSACGKYVFEITTNEKLKRRKAAKDERPDEEASTTTQVA